MSGCHICNEHLRQETTMQRVYLIEHIHILDKNSSGGVVREAHVDPALLKVYVQLKVLQSLFEQL